MGGRGRSRRPSGERPTPQRVERIDLSGKHMGLRIAAFILCLAIGIGALTFGVSQWLSSEPGWTQVEVTVEEKSCGGEFTLNYLLGQEGRNPTGELKAVRAAYNKIAVRAYRLFTPAESFDDPEDLGVSHNLCYINSHPNEDIVVDPALYRVLEQAEEHGSRALYLGPLYSVYNDLFFCEDDASAQELDPLRNQEMTEFCQELADFARNPDHVSVALLGGNTLRLEVSDQYREYAEGVGRACYLDLGWLRTAFLADYLAGELAAQGLTCGMLTSYDGVTRQLGEETGPQSLSLFDWTGERAVQAAQAEFPEPVNAVSLRTFPLNQRDQERCYVFENGSLRYSFIDPADGLCRASTDSLTLYAQEMGCGELALAAEPLLISDGLFPTELSELPGQGIQAVAMSNLTILYSDPELALVNLYSQPEQQYKTQSLQSLQ